MSMRDGSKNKRKTQKVIIPKGIIDPSDTTVIEIPAQLYGQAVIIAKKVDSPGSCTRVPAGKDSCSSSDRSYGKSQNCSTTNHTPGAAGQPGSSKSLRSNNQSEDFNSHLDETELAEKMMILSELEEYHKARRKFLMDASMVTSKSSISVPYQPDLTTRIIPVMESKQSARQEMERLPCSQTTLTPSCSGNNIPSRTSPSRTSTRKHVRSKSQPTGIVRSKVYLASAGTSTVDDRSRSRRGVAETSSSSSFLEPRNKNDIKIEESTGTVKRSAVRLAEVPRTIPNSQESFNDDINSRVAANNGSTMRSSVIMFDKSDTINDGLQSNERTSEAPRVKPSIERRLEKPTPPASPPQQSLPVTKPEEPVVSVEETPVNQRENTVGPKGHTTCCSCPSKAKSLLDRPKWESFVKDSQLTSSSCASIGSDQLSVTCLENKPSSSSFIESANYWKSYKKPTQPQDQNYLAYANSQEGLGRSQASKEQWDLEQVKKQLQDARRKLDQAVLMASKYHSAPSTSPTPIMSICPSKNRLLYRESRTYPAQDSKLENGMDDCKSTTSRGSYSPSKFSESQPKPISGRTSSIKDFKWDSSNEYRNLGKEPVSSTEIAMRNKAQSLQNMIRNITLDPGPLQPFTPLKSSLRSSEKRDNWKIPSHAKIQSRSSTVLLKENIVIKSEKSVETEKLRS